MEVLPDEMKGGVFEDLWKVLDIYSLPEDEQIRYECEHKYEADRKNIRDSYERRIREAEDTAKAEQERVREMARTMKSAGMPVDIIAKTSGLSIEEIKAL